MKIICINKRYFHFHFKVDAGPFVTSHLLDALALQRQHAGGPQLVGAVADSQAPVAVVAPAVQLRREMTTVTECPPCATSLQMPVHCPLPRRCLPAPWTRPARR